MLDVGGWCIPISQVRGLTTLSVKKPSAVLLNLAKKALCFSSEDEFAAARASLDESQTAIEFATFKAHNPAVFTPCSLKLRLGGSDRKTVG